MKIDFSLFRDGDFRSPNWKTLKAAPQRISTSRTRGKRGACPVHLPSSSSKSMHSEGFKGRNPQLREPQTNWIFPIESKNRRRPPDLVGDLPSRQIFLLAATAVVDVANAVLSSFFMFSANDRRPESISITKRATATASRRDFSTFSTEITSTVKISHEWRRQIQSNLNRDDSDTQWRFSHLRPNHFESNQIENERQEKLCARSGLNDSIQS